MRKDDVMATHNMYVQIIFDEKTKKFNCYADLGEVQEVNNDNVLTQKGVVSKDRYYLPKSLTIRFDGNKLWFNITKDEADKYKTD